MPQYQQALVSTDLHLGFDIWVPLALSVNFLRNLLCSKQKNRPFARCYIEGAKFFKKGQLQDSLKKLNLEQDQLNLGNKLTT